MRRRAKVQAVDTHGSRLRLITEPTDDAPVVSLRVPRDESTVLHLDVLAASHRVRLTACDGSLLVTETVSCAGPTDGRALWGGTRWHAGDRAVALSAGLWRSPQPTIVELADRLRDQLALRTDAVVVDFPGGAGAITALVTQPDGWRSWHLYPDPDDPHLVATRTYLAPPSRSA